MDERRFLALLRVVERANHTGFPNPYPPLAAWDPWPDDAAARAAWAAGPRGGEIGLYVHIPFCRARCAFCFLPVWSGRRAHAAYLDALAGEALLYAGLLGGRSLRSIYVGGGTPSLLEIRELERLFSLLARSYRLGARRQIAFEANPESLDAEKARALASFGVDWLTLGVQSLDSIVLRSARRAHSPASAARAFEAARRAGIAGINVDLLFGLPDQTAEGFLRDVAAVASWRPEQIHLNLYVDSPATPLSRAGARVPRRRFELCQRVQAEGFGLLRARGYARVDADSASLSPEAVNWQGTNAFGERASILGLGVVAVSYVRGRARYVNTRELGAYIRALERGRLPIERGIELGAGDEMRHFALHSLGHDGGLRRGEFREAFGASLESVFGPQLRRLVGEGVLRETENGYRLTGHGGAEYHTTRGFYEDSFVEKIAGRFRLDAAVG